MNEKQYFRSLRVFYFQIFMTRYSKGERPRMSNDELEHLFVIFVRLLNNTNSYFELSFSRCDPGHKRIT